jgi:hypothetical protein
MKLYIAGPITGDQDGFREKFKLAGRMLASVSFDVIDPTAVRGWVPYMDNRERQWPYYMRRCLASVLDADGVATLEDWQQSIGAKLEVDVAIALDMPVMPVQRWCDMAASMGNAHNLTPRLSWRSSHSASGRAYYGATAQLRRSNEE